MSPNPFLGELLGTMMLIILGDGVVAAVLLNKSKAQNSGWIVITTGWAFAVMVGVFTAIAFGSSDAHINPAVTLAFAVVSGDFSKLVSHIPAQMIGAFIGAVIVWLAYLSHWAETESQGFKLAVFCTGPAIRNAKANVITEIIGTMVLVLGVAAIFSKAVGGISAGVGPFLVAGLVWGIGLSLGGPTGYAINPARDLGPRVAHAVLPIAGKGESDWGYSWIPVVAPLVGGALAGLVLALVK
ncbi:MAG: aquaporin family protein [Chloroflexi bacterium]|nr:aquaporin family protein [Chloroflexota bacterium]